VWAVRTLEACRGQGNGQVGRALSELQAPMGNWTPGQGITVTLSHSLSLSFSHTQSHTHTNLLTQTRHSRMLRRATHCKSDGSSKSKMHELIMLVPKVAMRHPTAGPTASFIVTWGKGARGRGASRSVSSGQLLLCVWG